MSEKEKTMTAYHEAGHAIVGYLMPEHDPIHKVTIIPRGRALGITWFLPEADRISTSKRKLLSDIATAYGGRIAEEMIYGADGVSTGAYSDIQMATSIARAMVVNYGLSEKLGALDYDARDGEGFREKNISAHTEELIDSEIKTILDASYARATEMLQANTDILEAMKNALMEYETLDSEQVDDLMARRAVRAPRDWHNSNTGGDKPSGNAPEAAASSASPNNTPPNNVTPIGGPAGEH
ncbi:MAG TPA: ATP-dependent metalloprotease, partial [Pseudomonadales bacterium]|nr:ATP-dependent metalloprotease [Pseudomonadales bacterium]